MITTEFHSYPDIENAYRQSFIDKIREHGYGNILWCVIEKLHGANTQLNQEGATL